MALTLNFLPTPAWLVKMRHETKGFWNPIKPSARCGRKVEWMKLLNQKY